MDASAAWGETGLKRVELAKNTKRLGGQSEYPEIQRSWVQN